MDYLNKENLKTIFKEQVLMKMFTQVLEKMDPSHSGKLSYSMTKMNIKLMVYIINKRIQFFDIENNNLQLIKLADALKYQQELPLVTIIEHKNSFDKEKNTFQHLINKGFKPKDKTGAWSEEDLNRLKSTIISLANGNLIKENCSTADDSHYISRFIFDSTKSPQDVKNQMLKIVKKKIK